MIIADTGFWIALANSNDRHHKAFEVFDLDEKHAPRLLEIIHKYADLPADLADASLVVLAEHLGHGDILSTDLRDFRAYRWKKHHPFCNLLLD